MTQEPLEAVVRNIDVRLAKVEQILPTVTTHDQLAEAVAKLATKEELQEAVAKLATKEELQEAVAKLATKEELQEAVAKLATKEELRLESERVRRHMDVVAERLESKIDLVAEAVMAVDEKGDRRYRELNLSDAELDRRIMRLEAYVRSRR